MTADDIVQAIVTVLILAGVGWFIVRQLRGAAHSPSVLNDGDRVNLIKVRHITNGADLMKGLADSASGGSLILEPSSVTVDWSFGSDRIDHTAIRNPRIRNFGLARILVLEVAGEDRYWAFWIRRNKAPALVTHLTGKGVAVDSS